MYLVDKNGYYLKQYMIINDGDFLSLNPSTIKVTRIAYKEFATELPNTAGVFDLLELLSKCYPHDEWRVCIEEV